MTDEQTPTLSTAWAQAPRQCPDPSCGAVDDDEDTIGLLMRAYRRLRVAAIIPDDPTAAQFFWTCSACGLRWGHPPRPLVVLFLHALQFVSPARTVQAGAMETMQLSVLADLGSR